MSVSKNETKSPRVGLLIGQMEESYISLIWPGIIEYIEKNNATLIIFAARSPQTKDGCNFADNVINDFITEENIDGLIIMTGEMSNYLKRAKIEKLCRQFKFIPAVSIAYKLNNIPAVLVKNRTGILEAIDHLVQVHKHKRIAFIKGAEGNFEARIRFDAYKEGLSNNKIDFNSELVLPGNFTRETGRAAVELLIDKRKKKVDAILAADDVMALAALEALQDRGIVVPDEIAIVGFDDIVEAGYTMPPLTTVKQSLYEQGWTAAKTVLKMIKGEKVPDVIHLPTELVVRQSCGCLPKSVFSQKDAVFIEKKESNKIEKMMDKETVVSSVFNDFIDPDMKTETNKKWLFDVLNSFYEDLIDKEAGNRFLIAVYKMLNKNNKNDINIRGWQKIFHNLRHRVLSCMSDSKVIQKVDYLFQRSEILVEEVLLRKMSFGKILMIEKNWTLSEITRSLSTTFDIEELMFFISEEIPRLNVKNFFIALYDEDVQSIKNPEWKLPQESEIIFAHNDRGRIDLSKYDPIFLTRDIFHKKIHYNSTSWIIMPLFFKFEQFGFIVFEFDSEKLFLYEMLRSQISSVLKGALLLKERKEAENELRTAFSHVELVNKKLRNLSIKDELTGLYNRRGFMRLCKKNIELCKRSNKKFTIFYADLDGLKNINDTYGHKEGDRAIKEIANVLRGTFRDNDIIARLGGDEFTIMALDISENNIENIVKRIRDVLNYYNVILELEYRLSISLGTAIFDPANPLSLDELISNADNSLYEQKKKML